MPSLMYARQLAACRLKGINNDGSQSMIKNVETNNHRWSRFAQLASACRVKLDPINFVPFLDERFNRLDETERAHMR